MKINISEMHLTKQKMLKKTCLMIPIVENGELPPAADTLDKMSQGFIKQLCQQSGFLGKLDQCLPLFHLPHIPYDYVLLVGCGTSTKLTAKLIKQIMLKSMQILHSYSGISTIICYLSELYPYLHKKNM